MKKFCKCSVISAIANTNRRHFSAAGLKSRLSRHKEKVFRQIPIKILLLSIFLFSALTVFSAEAHHYKGLPHYSYFENYPEIPTLEFLEQIGAYEVFITIYNLQGINLDQVESPDDVRLYIYIFNVEEEKVYSGNASFRLMKKEKELFNIQDLASEQENIFTINRKILEEGDLKLFVSFVDPSEEKIEGVVKVRIKESFLSKYGLYVFFGVFLFL